MVEVKEVIVVMVLGKMVEEMEVEVAVGVVVEMLVVAAIMVGKVVNVKGTENTCLHKNLYMNVQTHTSQKVKTIQMALNG